MLVTAQRSILLRKRIPVATYVGSGGNNNSGGSGSNPYQWTSFPIGNPSYIGTRRIIVVIGAATMTATVPASGLTINGFAAVIHGEQRAATNNQYACIASALVPFGTGNITVVLNTNGSPFGNAFATCFSVDDSMLQSKAPISLNVASTSTGGTSLTCGNISVPPGGFIVGVGSLNSTPAGLAVAGFTTNAFGGTNTGIVFSDLTGRQCGIVAPVMSWTNSLTSGMMAAAWR